MTFKDASNLKANQVGKTKEVIHLSNLCTEILEVTSNKETAVCNLGSVNLGRHIVDGQFDFDKLARTVRTAVKYLDRVVDINFYPISTAADSNHRWRPVGLGVMGLQDVFFQLRLAFDSEKARELSRRIQEEIYYNALVTSNELAKHYGPHAAFKETKAADGLLQFDLWGVKPTDVVRWNQLKEEIKKHGLRNSLLIAIAPTATIASIVGCYEATEPQISNLFKRETLSGEFMQINRYLVTELKKLGLWNEDLRNEIKLSEGSIQALPEIPPELKEIYRTVWEVPMKGLLEMGAERGAFIDQSQSLNLFMESPTIGKLSSMYMYAWKQGLKTTYYLRSRPATSIAKTTVRRSNIGANSASSTTNTSTSAAESLAKVDTVVSATTTTEKTYSDSEVIACSLENPEACEACQ
jgi:ribonucleoside-diphosphate reductase alpha chain